MPNNASATGPLAGIEDAMARMPRYLEEAVAAANKMDDNADALRPYLTDEQAAILKELTYYVLSRGNVIAIAGYLIKPKLDWGQS